MCKDNFQFFPPFFFFWQENSQDHISLRTCGCNVHREGKAMDKQTLEMVNAGLHCSLRISKHILPLLLMLGWNTFVLNAT